LNQPATFRRSTVAAVLGVAASAVLTATPVLPVVQAIAVFADGPVRVAGVSTVASLPSLHMAVVRGDAAGLDRLARSRGVLGLAQDDAVQVAGADTDLTGEGHLAWEGLGGPAGRPGAGHGVRVAVVDTGVSDTAALSRASGRLVDVADSSSGTLETGGVYADGYGHGTFMAGVIAGGPVAATDGDALGVAPGATVLVVRVAKQDGTTSLSRVLAGLEWVNDHADDIDVVSVSLSKRRPLPRYGVDPLTAAIETIRASGVTPVVAAGNRPGQVGDPGFTPGALTVGAADLSTERVATFSGSARVAGIRKPDVVANGVRVLGLVPQDSVIGQITGTTRLPSGLFRGSGTSQATAVTAGVAALVVAAHPEATPAQVKGSLRCASTSLPGKRDGQGLVHYPATLCAGSDGQALDGSGDTTGELDFDAGAWGAGAWGAGAWGAGAWGAGAWGAGAWGAGAWGAGAWGAGAWGAGAWGAGAWGAGAWAATDFGEEGAR
jgi:serine protease AprX